MTKRGKSVAVVSAPPVSEEAVRRFLGEMRGPGFRAAPFTPDIAIDASHLPGDPHPDPADRMLIATARHLNAPIVTRDRRNLAYAERGDVAALAC